MQPMLGVSFVNTQSKTVSQTESISLVDPSLPAQPVTETENKSLFNQMFNDQIKPIPSNKDIALEGNDEKTEMGADGKQLPVELSKIGNNLTNIHPLNALNGEFDLDGGGDSEQLPVVLSQIGKSLTNVHSLDDLKDQFEQNGLKPLFFDIALNSDDEINIQPTSDIEMEEGSIQDYSNILILQLPEDIQLSAAPNTLTENDFEFLESIDKQEISDDLDGILQALMQAPSIMQWAKVSDAKGGDSDIEPLIAVAGEGEAANESEAQFVELDFEALNQLLITSQNADVEDSENSESSDIAQSIALLVLPNTQKEETQITAIQNDNQTKPVVSSFMSEQIYSQANIMSQITPAVEEGESINQDMPLLFKGEKSSNESKWLGELKPISQLNSETEAEQAEFSDEMDMDSSEVDLQDLDLKDETKSKRAIMADQINVSDKSTNAKSPTIELPAISLSDAKQTSQSIKMAASQGASLLETVIPEKQAVKLTEEMGSRVMMLHTQKMTSALIRLDPPELGALEVKIETSGDEAKVTIVTQQLNVKEALDSQANRLKEMLQEQGFTQVDVDVKDQSDSSDQAQNEEDSDKTNNGVDGELDSEGDIQAQEKSVHLLDQFV